MVRSVKNDFAPINRIPPEVLSLIPDYCDNYDTLITLTHVCHGWRELFISRSSLWASLDCTNVEKTRVYIERSKSSPLEISLLEKHHGSAYCDEALLLAAPHINRLSSLDVYGPSHILADLNKYFTCPTPLLRKLKIDLAFDHNPAPSFPGTLFNGDLSSLRKLSLAGFTTNLPWRNLVNLTTFELHHSSGTVDPPFVTRLLDFFESAPLLSKIELCHSIPASSNVPPERLVSLPHLKKFSTTSRLAQSTLLNHLSVPNGALLVIAFTFSGEDSPIPTNLPKDLSNLNNLCHVTAMNLSFHQAEKLVRLSGPSGGLYIYGTWTAGGTSSHALESRIFYSLDRFNLSRIQSLAVTKYTSSPSNEVEKSPIFRSLFQMNDLRTLTLIECNNLSFIYSLNPEKNESDSVLCPNLEEVVIYFKKRDWFCLEELMEMALERDERRMKLQSVTIVSIDEMCSKKEVFKLRRYVSHVEYKLDVVSPEWDAISGDEDSSSDESDW